MVTTTLLSMTEAAEMVGLTRPTFYRKIKELSVSTVTEDGKRKVDVSELQEIPNVHLLGRKSYETLPAYCAAFDAGLMLFSRTVMTKNVNPIKMMEYLAAGLPVVSTPLPEAERYQGPITIAETAEDFARACDQAVCTKSPNRRQSISQLVTDETWQSKVEFLSEAIVNRLKLTGRTMSKPARIVAASPIITSGWRRRRKPIRH